MAYKSDSKSSRQNLESIRDVLSRLEQMSADNGEAADAERATAARRQPPPRPEAVRTSVAEPVNTPNC